MKRIAVLYLESCHDCPYLFTIDGFSSHHYTCNILGVSSSKIESPYGEEDTSLNEMKNWFDNLCTLDKEE